jgi:hypothetical protein
MPRAYAHSVTGSLVLDEVVGVIGWAATMQLVRALGGTRTYVPAQCDPDHPIAIAIGLPTAQALCDSMHQTTLSIPIGLRRELHVRELAAVVPPLKARDIATRVGIPERSVFHILSRAPGQSMSSARNDPAQPGLFDL